MHVNLGTTQLVEKIFEASTLEDAIFWRAEMVERLKYALAIADNLSSDERDLYIRAKAQTERSIDHLQAALAKGARWSWVRDSATR